MHLDPTDLAICLGHDEDPDGKHRGMTPPVVQSSLFTFPTFEALADGLRAEHTRHVYSRGQNPTVEVLERKLATLERGEACKCFASGMGAVAGVMLGLLEAGDHVLFANQTYGPTIELAEHLERFGIEHDLTLDLDPDGIEASITPSTKMLWLESPGTMLCRMMDVPAVAAMAKRHGVTTVLDNSWATPLCQKPISMGVDIVVHSVSKYLGGHSDLMAGAVIGSREVMERIFYRSYLLAGASLSPHDAWLVIRGMRTLPTRLERHEANVIEVVEFLESDPAVAAVYHPATWPDQDLVRRQLKGLTGLMSFELQDDLFEDVCKVLNRLEHFRLGVSWGGPESLALSPNLGDNLDFLASQAVPPGLIRLSIGLEPVDMLIEDLRQALAATE